MATLDYTHTLGGNGVATGLPVRRGSHLYEHDPMWQYPDMVDKGMHRPQEQFGEETYRRLPHLPILHIREPDIDNPDRPGDGNFTRRQYFVIKAGQPLMATHRDDPAIGLFYDDSGSASTEDRHYIDPQKMRRTGTILGFFKANREQLKDDGNVTLANPGADADAVVKVNDNGNLEEIGSGTVIETTGTVADETALGNLSQSDLDTMADRTINADDTSDTGADGFRALVLDDGSSDTYIYEYDQSGGTDVAAGSNLAGTWTKDPDGDGPHNEQEASEYDYKQVTEDDPVSIDRYQGLSDEEQEGWFTVYENNEDTNDEISTGGVDMYAKTEKALFGETDRVEHVTVDAGTFYFVGSSTNFVGFVSPSSGGADRTLFYNEIDEEAQVTLPSDGDPSTEDFVQAIGSVTDVSADNISAYENSAAYFEAQPTVGVSEVDLEQAFSHVYHNFSTGTEPYQPMRTGAVEIPFINLSAFESVITNSTDLTWNGNPNNADTFNFVDQSESRSGVKVGVYGETDLSIVNKASLLTGRDEGYANLHHNLPATFLVATEKPQRQDKVKPDLFGNWTLADAGILEQTGGTFGGNFQQATESDNVDGSVDMEGLGLGKHVIGAVTKVMDTPNQGRIDLTELRLNPIFQNRIPDSSANRNISNAPNQRVGGSADTAGADQLLSDATFLALGGGNSKWFTSLLPDFNGLGQDPSNILEELVLAGAIGKVKIGFDTTNIR